MTAARPLRTLYLEWSPPGSDPDNWDSLSYSRDWRAAFVESPRLDVFKCDISSPSEAAEAIARFDQFDLIVVSHIALGDNVEDISQWSERLATRRGALVSFIGNEYDLMDEKLAFLQAVAPELVCSQLTLDAARYLYADLTKSRVVSMPHALNPAQYSTAPHIERTIDIGFIGSVYPNWVGDVERTLMLTLTAEIAPLLGLRHDIRLKNVPRDAWAAFLQQTRTIIGAESGSYYLHRRGKLLAEAKAWSREHPDATFEDMAARFFGDRSGVPSGKTISSRHFEPIGTRTCQVLVEGDYTGVLLPNEHYIPVRKDFADIGEALTRVADHGECAAIADRAWEHIMSGHTYAHRVNAILDQL